ncbi:38316_t:CDS:2, partial [Gigaspora margarita]
MKLEGDITAINNWPWSLEEMIIDKVNGLKMTVKWIVRWLNALRSGHNTNIDNHSPDNFRYQTCHLDSGNNEDCIWCAGVRQTIEHFVIECNLSKEIWRIAYNLMDVTA